MKKQKKSELFKTVIFSLIPSVILILLLEVGARTLHIEQTLGQENYSKQWLADSFNPDEFIKNKEINGKEYYYSDQYPVVYYFDEYNNDNLDGKYVLKDKNDKSLRIFSFGGSSTAGSPFGHWGSFTRFLKDQLVSISKPNINIETINFGTSGGTAARAAFILNNVTYLKPDFIVIYAGHNEICDLGANIYAKTDGSNTFKFFYKHSEFIRTFAALYRQNIAPPAPPLGELRFNIHQCIRPTIAYERAELIKQYEESITSIVKIATDKNIKVILINQFANMFIKPSDKSSGSESHQPTNSINNQMPGERSILLANSDKEFESLLAKKKYNELHIKADALLKSDKTNPLAYYYQGLAYLGNNDKKSAYTALLRAQNYDRMPYRYLLDYDQILQEQASKNDGVYFIDLYADLPLLVNDSIINGRLVMDTMHPSIELNKYIANQIVSSMGKNNLHEEFLDYSNFKKEDLYGTFETAEKYKLICKRYYSLDSWDDCIKKAKSDYFEAEKEGDIARINREKRTWENLYYYSVVNNNNESLEDSRAIATMNSNSAK